MAKYTKKGSNIEITELNKNEILALLKANISCTLSFSRNDTIMDSIVLVERIFQNSLNKIIIEFKGKTQQINYDTLIAQVGKNLSFDILTVIVDEKTFKEKEPLFLLFDKVKTEIIENCVFFDYVKEVYSIINQPIKGLSNKLYYFEANNSVLLFGENGPKLIYNKFTAVEELFC